MDKLLILQSVTVNKIMDNLNTDETRLYLILLANSGEDGEGKVLFRAINGVLGEGFCMDRLMAACRRLAECGLIEVTASALEQINDDDSKLVYKIFPLEQKGSC